MSSCVSNVLTTYNYIFGEETARADLSAFWGECSINPSACLGRSGNKSPQGTYYGFAGGFGDWQFGKTHGNGEVFADMFVGWVYNKWENSAQGGYRRDYMNRQIQYYLTMDLAKP